MNSATLRAFGDELAKMAADCSREVRCGRLLAAFGSELQKVATEATEATREAVLRDVALKYPDLAKKLPAEAQTAATARPPSPATPTRTAR